MIPLKVCKQLFCHVAGMVPLSDCTLLTLHGVWPVGSVSHHEDIKLVQHSEGAVGGRPEGEQEAHSGVGSLST